MTDERVDRAAAAWKANMERDFAPGYRPENMPSPEQRLANAAEYAAYQLGQMNRNLTRLLDLLARREEL